jgi:D-inositol-3-phosphate glycosyltransferase
MHVISGFEFDVGSLMPVRNLELKNSNSFHPKRKGEGLNTEILRIAMISMHSSPMGELGSRDTGGMSVYVREVARRLARTGYAVDIFTRVQDPARLENVQPFENVRVIHLPAGPAQPLPQLELYRHLPEFFENLEHIRGVEGIEYDLVHSHYWLSGLIGRRARKRWRVPHVFMFHTLGVLKNRTAGSEKEPDLRITMEKQLATECDLILAGTGREKRHLTELYGTLPQRIQVVPCGVDLERFQPAAQLESRARLGFHQPERLILYVGRFDPIKGVDRLLAAAARLRRAVPLRVVLVGGGEEDAPEVRALRALCSELSLEDCVTFAGRRSHGDLPDYYRAADVLVLPSYYESFGLVVLEALASGTPVVATRVGAVEDIVRNGVNGWVVSDNTPESLAEGVRQVLEQQGSQRMMADAIRATIEDYDWNFVAASIDKEYRVLLGREDVLDSTRAAACGSVCR